ncbi:PTS sugar transporter subunit IIC [Natranaerobius trueperi]|uniref:PTS sugar transporter subunit IIC n=1 Tax=Natranaerobius trueperi TaxID=759412 RepID=UPI00197BC24E|nr:PTS sugar transporter subunit IIC [Natranaerobius trueperi]
MIVYHLAESSQVLSIIPGYVMSLAIPYIEKSFPKGTELIIGAVVFAPASRLIGVISTPIVDTTLLNIGDTILLASQQAPIVMGFLLGGIIKMICLLDLVQWILQLC